MEYKTVIKRGGKEEDTKVWNSSYGVNYNKPIQNKQ